MYQKLSKLIRKNSHSEVNTKIFCSSSKKKKERSPANFFCSQSSKVWLSNYCSKQRNTQRECEKRRDDRMRLFEGQAEEKAGEEARRYGWLLACAVNVHPLQRVAGVVPPPCTGDIREKTTIGRVESQIVCWRVRQ